MAQPLDANFDDLLLLPPAVDDWIGRDHPARFFKQFVDSINLEELGFEAQNSLDGRPPFAICLALRVWLYGYYLGIFSTRKLERACKNDIGMIWLSGNLRPDHNTLWRFWRDHKSQIKNLFKKTVELAINRNLVGIALQAVDGTKIQAVCSGKSGWSKQRIEELLAALENKLAVAESSLLQDEGGEDPAKLPPELENQRRLKEALEEGLAQLNETGRKHFNRKEPEARRMKCEGRNRFAYNAQAVADSKTGIITGAEVYNHETDVGLLTPMIEQAQENTAQKSELTLADSGYGSGEDLMAAKEAGHEVLAPHQQENKDHEYHASRFKYEAEKDVFICPQGKELTFEKERQRPDRGLTRNYRCHHRDCPVRHLCSKDKRGRSIEKYPTYEVSREMREKLVDPENKKLLRRRGVIIEPVFAVVKERLRFRRWTFRGLEKVQSQWFLICSVVNLMKIMNGQAKTT